eukprot:g2241.t1
MAPTNESCVHRSRRLAKRWLKVEPRTLLYYKSERSKQELGSYALDPSVEISKPKDDDPVFEGQKYVLCIRGLKDNGVRRKTPLVIYGTTMDEVVLFATAIKEASRAGLTKKERRSSSSSGGAASNIKASIKVFFGASGYLLKKLSQNSSVCADALMLAAHASKGQVRAIYDIMAKDRSLLASVKPPPEPQVLGAVLLRALEEIGPIFPDEVLLKWLVHFKSISRMTDSPSLSRQHARQVAELLRLLPMKSLVLLEALFSFLRRSLKASSLLRAEDAVAAIRKQVMPPLPERVVRPAWMTPKLWRAGLRRLLLLILRNYDEIFGTIPKMPASERTDREQSISSMRKDVEASAKSGDGSRAEDDGVGGYEVESKRAVSDRVPHQNDDTNARGGSRRRVRFTEDNDDGIELASTIRDNRGDERQGSERRIRNDARVSGSSLSSKSNNQVAGIDGDEKVDMVHDSDDEDEKVDGSSDDERNAIVDLDEIDNGKEAEEEEAVANVSRMSDKAGARSDPVDDRTTSFDATVLSEEERDVSDSRTTNDMHRTNEANATVHNDGGTSSEISDLDEDNLFFSDDSATSSSSSGEETLRMMRKNVPVDLRMSSRTSDPKLASIRERVKRRAKARAMHARAEREAEQMKIDEERRREREAELLRKKKAKERADVMRRARQMHEAANREAERARVEKERELARVKGENDRRERRFAELKAAERERRRLATESRRKREESARQLKLADAFTNREASTEGGTLHDLSTLKLSDELTSASDLVVSQQKNSSSLTAAEEDLFDMIRMEKDRDRRIVDARRRRDRAVAEKAKAAALRRRTGTVREEEEVPSKDVKELTAITRERHMQRDRARAKAVSRMWEKVKSCKMTESRATDTNALKQSQKMLRVLRSEIDDLKSTTQSGSSLRLMLDLLSENAALNLTVSEYQEDIVERTRRKHEQFLSMYGSTGSRSTPPRTQTSRQDAGGARVVDSTSASPFRRIVGRLWGPGQGPNTRSHVSGNSNQDEDEEEEEEADAAW